MGDCVGGLSGSPGWCKGGSSCPDSCRGGQAGGARQISAFALGKGPKSSFLAGKTLKWPPWGLLVYVMEDYVTEKSFGVFVKGIDNT